MTVADKTSINAGTPYLYVGLEDRGSFGSLWNNNGNEPTESQIDETVSLDTSAYSGLATNWATVVTAWGRYPNEGTVDLSITSDIDQWWQTQATNGRPDDSLSEHSRTIHRVGVGYGGGAVDIDWSGAYEGGWMLYLMSCELGVWQWPNPAVVAPVIGATTYYQEPGEPWSGGPPYSETFAYNAPNVGLLRSNSVGTAGVFFGTHLSVFALTGFPDIDDDWTSIFVATPGDSTSNWIYTQDGRSSFATEPFHLGYTRVCPAGEFPTDQFTVSRSLPGPAETRDYATSLSLLGVQLPMMLVNPPRRGRRGLGIVR